MEINKSDFLEAGVQFGHYKNQNNPNMKKFIFTTKNGISIIDLKKIMSYSSSTYQQIKEFASTGAEILFVNKKKHASEIMQKAAVDCSCPYMVKNWPGGFLTNFRTVSREIFKIDYLTKTNEQNYSISKKEKLRNEKKIENLKSSYEGVLDLKKIPEAIFIFGLKSAEGTVVKEAKKLGVKIIAICDSDSNPYDVDYLIPGNDDGLKSTNFFINLVSNAIKEGKTIYQNGSLNQSDKSDGKDSSFSAEKNIDSETEVNS